MNLIGNRLVFNLSLRSKHAYCLFPSHPFNLYGVERTAQVLIKATCEKNRFKTEWGDTYFKKYSCVELAETQSSNIVLSLQPRRDSSHKGQPGNSLVNACDTVLPSIDSSYLGAKQVVKF